MRGGLEMTRAIKRSTLVGFIIFAIFGILLIRILLIQTVDFEKYQSKVIEQMTTESAVPANRGKIYDKNGNVLATNITTYRVFISPSGIKAAEEETKVKYADGIAKGFLRLSRALLMRTFISKLHSIPSILTEPSRVRSMSIRLMR